MFRVTKLMLMLSVLLVFAACNKDEDDPQPPVVSFETSQIAVNTDDNSSFDVKLRLSAPAHMDFTVNLNVTGTAVENEHYTIPAREIALTEGDTEGILPITILNENIWEEDLTIDLVIAPGIDYAIDPEQVTSISIRLTKEIILPEFFFETTDALYTNPFNAETLTLTILSDAVLSQDVDLKFEFDSELVIGDDFTINETAENTFVFPAGETSMDIEVNILQKDQGGFKENLEIKLVAANPQRAMVRSEQSARLVEVYDPVVDFSPLLNVEAVLGLSGYQMRQAIKGTDNGWSGNTILNVDANTDNPNYMQSFRNFYFQDNVNFNCHMNGPGGDVLRLANMLVFETTDTTIADYGAARTVRYFSPSQELLRFVAEDKDETMRGTVTANRQMFTANLVLRSEWEDGSGADMAWRVDSRATNGVIENSTFPTFHTVEIWLEKVEGTYDFTKEEPEVVFEAWFSSDSPYFMRNVRESMDLDVVYEDNMYKVTYRFYPR